MAKPESRKKVEYKNKEEQQNRPRVQHNCAKIKLRFSPLALALFAAAELFSDLLQGRVFFDYLDNKNLANCRSLHSHSSLLCRAHSSGQSYSGGRRLVKAGRPAPQAKFS